MNEKREVTHARSPDSYVTTSGSSFVGPRFGCADSEDFDELLELLLQSPIVLLVKVFHIILN